MFYKKERRDARKEKIRAYFENPLLSFEILESLMQSLLIFLLLCSFCYELLLIEFRVQRKSQGKYLKNVKKIYLFFRNLLQHYLE
jgi:polynucleotide 5'-kinase involved in rRNA processing